ncbi:ABC-2 type transporter-domain-containing protein [Dipodascopsis uninucleata]
MQTEKSTVTSENDLSQAAIPEAEQHRWGEPIRGQTVEIEQAEQDFSELSRELSRLSRVKSHQSEEKSIGEYEKQISTDEEQPDFDLSEWIRNDSEKTAQNGVGTKKIGVSFQNLSVVGVDLGSNKAQTVLDALFDGIGGALVKWARSKVPGLSPKVPLRTILHDFNGLVRSGEMLLVLGSPGSGTTTLLKALTNQREGYVAVNGDVIYDGMDHITAKKQYRGEIIFNEEDDRHIPTLTVRQTLKFALSLKTPRVRAVGESNKDFIDKLIDLYGKMFGISHTMNTLVAGISGGEKKRVSIAEVLANRAAIVAFDNSTRGLDASTAVDYIRSLRILTNLTYSTTIVTLYQAGESLYKEFDKVCVVDSGHQIFFGPVNEASQYFENLGFERPELMTTADFLTSVTHPAERKIKKGWEERVPQTPEELEAAFKASKYYSMTLNDIKTYHEELANTGNESLSQFTEAVKLQKSKIVGSKSSYTVSFFKQVQMLVIRDLQYQWQDKTTLKNRIVNSIICAFVFGSVFYNLSLDVSGIYPRGGVLFFILGFNSWVVQVASAESIAERPLLNKHVRFGMVRKSAFSVAKTISDFPVTLTQTTIFFLILYFMSNAHRTAGAFFVALLFVQLMTFMMLALYRAFAVFCGSIDSCLRYMGVLVVYVYFWAGYARPAKDMQWWFRWAYYIDPFVYAFEALTVNEFHNRDMKCDELVPSIPGASIENQACPVPGAVSGQEYVSGDAYLLTQLNYSYTHLWRNFGILIGYYVFFVAVQVLFIELIDYNGFSAQIKSFVTSPNKDIDSRLKYDDTANRSDDSTDCEKQVIRGSLYTFTNVNYTVPTANGAKQLLDHVEGYAVSGKLLALMGSSGAGKTTLLNTISQRMTVGVVSGDFALNGMALSKSFQRTTGFVEQQDLHEAKQTIREALRFSARLRQPAHVPLKEKYAFVEDIIRLLDLDNIADALIDYVGFGLSVEERKRVTIGVELAAKPAMLFLDEPTSGLDSEGSFSIITFLRRLALQSGIGIICTIHQPSAILFSKFDNLLLLGRGGKTVYFGPIGDKGNTVINYISRHAKRPNPEDNPAEYILEATGAGIRRSSVDWPKVWQESEEVIMRRREIEALNQEWKSNPPPQLPENGDDIEYASGIIEQTKAVTTRLWLTIWRTPSLGYSFLYAALATGLVGGILFFDLQHTIIGAQDRSLLMFLPMLAVMPIINSYEIHFIFARNLYELREKKAKVYSWIALVSAYIICIVPYAIICAVIFFPTFWYMPKLSTDSSAAGYGFWMLLLLAIWNSHLAVFMGGFVPSMSAAGIINPLFFVALQLSFGVSVPYNQLNGFFKHFIYWINPAAWMIRGLTTTALHNVEIECDPVELAVFSPPTGSTCEQYAGEWVNSTYGVLLNPTDSENCKYCQYTTGDDYLSSIGFSYSTRWRDLGVSIMFVCLNVFLCYVSYYFAREQRFLSLTRLFTSLKNAFKSKD